MLSFDTVISTLGVFFFPKKSNLLRFWLLLGIPKCNATQRVLRRVCFSKLYKLAPYIENLER